VALVAVAQCGQALLYTWPQLRADREVVLAAVAQYGHALEFASEELKMDRGVVTVAVAQNRHALRYASAALQSALLRERRFRPFQRLMVATLASRGVDCSTAAPLVVRGLPPGAVLAR